MLSTSLMHAAGFRSRSALRCSFRFGSKPVQWRRPMSRIDGHRRKLIPPMLPRPPNPSRRVTRRPVVAEFLFEIGFEEMPAPWLSGLAEQLQAKFTALANDEQLAPSAVRVAWTSRRLVLVAQVKP